MFAVVSNFDRDLSRERVRARIGHGKALDKIWKRGLSRKLPNGKPKFSRASR